MPLERRSYGWENAVAKGKERKEAKRFGKWTQGWENLLVSVKVVKELKKVVKVAALKFRRL